MQNGQKSLHDISSRFFDYLGRHIPHLCANDEFYFLPRSETAIGHLNTLDDLSPEKIQDHVQYVRSLLREMSSQQGDDLEGEIDFFLLKHSMKRFIREFEGAKVWRNDPTLYVKIPLFATGRILSQRDHTRDRIKADLLPVFDQIPGFLGRAIKNLSSPSEICLEVASDMARDALHFHQHDIPSFLLEKVGDDQELFKKRLNHVMSADPEALKDASLINKLSQMKAEYYLKHQGDFFLSG